MFYIRIVFLWKEISIGDFDTVIDAQKFLRQYAFMKQGDSDLFWFQTDSYNLKPTGTRYLAEIVRSTQTVAMENLDRWLAGLEVGKTDKQNKKEFTIQVSTFRYYNGLLTVASIMNYGKFEIRQEPHNFLKNTGWWSKGEPITEEQIEPLDEYDFRQTNGNMLFAKIEKFVDIMSIEELSKITREEK